MPSAELIARPSEARDPSGREQSRIQELLEAAVRDHRLNELEILRQSVEERGWRLQELEKKVEWLEEMLQRLAAAPRSGPYGNAPAPPAGLLRPIPRRWNPK